MDIEKFFNPASVAIVGASGKTGKVGYEITANMIKAGYKGEIFPVNPNSTEIQGLKCYPDLESIGRPCELVVIVVPARGVPAVMRQCAKIGTKAVVIITAGFKEVGREGAGLEKDLMQIARQAGIRVIGPNCLGVIAPSNRLNASFGGGLPAAGSIAYLSQSGALLAAILDKAAAAGIGFSKLVSIGNKADVNELEIMKYLATDPETKVIAGYLESIDHGHEFVRQATEISRTKPILLMKSGGTEAGSRAASSHTGSLAGSETTYECVFERAGIIRCESITRQFDYALAFAGQPLPKGPSVAVITNAGGPGIMTADAIERAGLAFARFSQETKDRLAVFLPAAANIHNPVDILGDALADRYRAALEVVLQEADVDSILVLLTPQAMTEAEATAAAVVEAAADGPGKPVLACFLGAGKVDKAVEILTKGSIPCYDCPESAVVTVKAMSDYIRWRSRPKRVVKLFSVNRRKVEAIIQRHLRQGMRQIGEADAKEILEAYGFVTPKGSVAATAEHAVNIAAQIGYPVVLKIWSPDIVHKSDVGGVQVGLNSDRQVRDAFDLMMYRIPKKQPDAKILGVLVQQMCTSNMEVILGMHRDRHFGPVMMFGMGGVMVEVLKDVSFYLAPLTAEEARQMLVNTRTYQMLKGVRGTEGVDIDQVAEALQRVSQLATEFPQIQELDINPYIVGPEGSTAVAVDARISVEEL